MPATGQLTVSGSVAGTMTFSSGSVCVRAEPPNQDLFELDFKGTGLTTEVTADRAQSGKEWVVVVDGSVNNPDAVDAGLGPGAYKVSIYISHAGDGNQSSVTARPDLHSGSLSLQLKADPASRPGGQVRVTGTFACAF